MAACREGVICDAEKFLFCYSKLLSFHLFDSEESKTNLNVLLDELNSVYYSPRFVTDENANQLLQKLTNTVPFQHERIISKVCQVVINLKVRQQVTLSDSTVQTLVEFLVKALHRCQPFTHSDILNALSVILYENVDRVHKSHEALVGKLGILLQLAALEGMQDEEVLAGALQCLKNLTIKLPNQNGLSEEHAAACFRTFRQMIHQASQMKLDSSVQCKILISCLRGVQNLLMTSKVDLTHQLGALLAGIRAHMFHGLLAQPQPIPACLYPIETYEPNQNANKTSQSVTVVSDASIRGGGGAAKKANKKKKVLGKKDGKKEGNNGAEDESMTEMRLEGVEEEWRRGGGDLNDSASQLWARLSSSDSEFSDTEGDHVSRLRLARTRVRQCALNCLHTLVKNIDRKIMFGYLTSFIPTASGGSSSPVQQTLFTCILKEPSPKCRMGAVAALTAMLDGTKPFLAVAEESDPLRTAFIPFSVTLGTMIKELHRCLLQALVAENFSLTLTQLIKCLSTLVMNITYHRLHPGLLARVVKQIRHFLNHKDPNVRVACLTCLGAIVSIQPPLLEVCHIVQPPHPPVGSACPLPPAPPPEEGVVSVGASSLPEEIGSFHSLDSGYGGSSSLQSVPSGSSALEMPRLEHGELGVLVPGGGELSNLGTSGLATPILAASPGTQTPVFSDQTLQAYASETSWLIKLCIRNIIPQPVSSGQSEAVTNVEPVPVRLESLQVLANLTKGYFPIIRNSVKLLQDLIQTCFEDRDPIVKLHGTKLLDELTQAMARDLVEGAGGATSLGQVLEFWLYLLSGPLPALMQSQGNNPVRANACDCISNIGPQIFLQLPSNKKILCITLVLGLTGEDDKLVKSAAVRTLGVYVLYSCLRDDVSFVADAANAILNCMEDSSVNVRMKAAWSLANLCDALVLNRDASDSMFMSDFSDMLLLKLLRTATQATSDSDKVKSNAVRAVGNILRYLPERSLGKGNFQAAIQDSVKALVKNIQTGTMKVRWNACYAVGNLFRNQLLPHGSVPWTGDVLRALCSVMCECKNFKVRINSALALSMLQQRQHYGDCRQFADVFEALALGLKSSENTTDFAEYRYRDNLTEQICVAVFHLCSLVTVEDMGTLLPMLQTRGAILQNYTSNYSSLAAANSPSSEQGSGDHLTSAWDNLTLLSSVTLTPNQQLALTLLRKVCLPPKGAEKPAAEASPKSGFQQIYD